ncbi:MAG: inositol monophosphatase [Saprospiraceae bacterium]|nr:inositol monophosphatase [Saprospiraceae bacterium]MBP7679987.1 inositol monophosphatase [Saprospiraceae bacterium]
MLSQNDLEHLCCKTCTVVIQAAQFIEAQFGQVQHNAIEEKSLNNLVSYVDKTAESILIEGLQPLLPEAAFLVEEQTVAWHSSDYLWVVDPLDGTTNFLHNLPWFAVSVGLQYKGTDIMGIVYDVMNRQLYYAWLGGGAYLQGQRLHVSSTTTLQQSLLVTGFPYYDYSKSAPYLQLLNHLTQATRGIRRLGSAALDLVYVAKGTFEVFYEYSLQPWDVVGGAVIVREAGGMVSDFSGKPDYITPKEIVASNTLVHTEFIRLTQRFFVV